jgi:CheY-like chemotaxis protein
MKILVLEDDPIRISKFHSVCEAAGIDLAIHDNVNDFIVAAQLLDYEAIFLDHDLGGQVFVDTRFHNTGSGAVRWMVAEHGYDVPIIIHSMNTPAAISMEKSLVAGNFSMVYRVAWIILKHQLREIIEEIKIGAWLQ